MHLTSNRLEFFQQGNTLTLCEETKPRLFFSKPLSVDLKCIRLHLLLTTVAAYPTNHSAGNPPNHGTGAVKSNNNTNTSTQYDKIQVMKSKRILDETLHTHIDIHWDCTVEEMDAFVEKRLGSPINKAHSDTLGRTYCFDVEDGVLCRVWVKNKDYMDTLAHEILHAVRFLLQGVYDIPLSRDTEEIYTILHSFYMSNALVALGHKNLAGNI